MPEPAPEARADSTAHHVTRNFWPIAIFAALLLFFGFYWFQRPSGSGVFLIGDTLFQYTLRIGGIVMAALALSSLTGKLGVLALDGVGSVAIGVLLIGSALLMLAGGDRSINQFIYIICGVMTASSGWRNWRDYRILSGGGGLGGSYGGGEYDPNFAQAYEQVKSEPAGPSLASQLRERTQQAASDEAEPPPERASTEPRPVEEAAPTSGRSPGRPVPQELVEPVSQSPHSAPEGEQTGASDPYEAPASTGDDDEEPPDGFLAGFADEGPPRRP